MSRLMDKLIENEGFRAMPYKCSLGYDTAGIGTKLPLAPPEVELLMRFRFDKAIENIKEDGIDFNSDLFPLTKDEAKLLAESRLNQDIDKLLKIKPIVLVLSQERQEVIFDMMYNLGIPRLLDFKKMWNGIETQDFATASAELLDSRYAKQVPNRATRNAKEMGGIYV